MKRKKAIKKYDKLLNSYIKDKEFIKIERTFPEGEFPVSGFLLNNSKEFILIQQSNDFRFDGYSIIPKNQFDQIRNNKVDKTYKRILKKEGILDKDYGIKEDLNLRNWRTIFKSLKKQDRPIIVECENKKESVFLIGPIKKIRKKSVSIQYFDAEGVLEKRPTKVKYKDITIVRFEERYINVYRKYLTNKKK